jgi:hypothetical protein
MASNSVLSGRSSAGCGSGLLYSLELEDSRMRRSPSPLELVEQARQLEPPVNLSVRHGGADSPPADKEALVDHLLDRAPDRRPRKTQPLAHRQLVLEGVPGFQLTLADGAAELLRELVVERDRRTAVDPEVDELSGH